MISQLHSKKGQAATFGMEHLVKIVFTIMVAVFFFYIGLKIYMMLFSYNKDAMYNFNAVADSMEQMLQKQDQFGYVRLQVRIKEPYNIQGYNGAFDGSAKDGPEECGGYPCLCISKEAESKKCRVFKPQRGTMFIGRIVTMLSGYYAPSKDIGFQNIKNDVPACYGSDFQMAYKRMTYFTDDDAEFEEIYLEKVVCGQDNYIMLGERLSLPTINARINSLSMCPAESDNECNNVRRNSGTSGGFCYYDDSNKKCTLEEAKHCELGKKITDKCICGSRDPKELVNPVNKKATFLYKQFKYEGDLYCNKRESDGLELVTPFSCDSICECRHYCYFNSDDDECDEIEAQYCNAIDICAVPGSCVIEDNRCQLIVGADDDLNADQLAMVSRGCEGKTPISIKN